MEQISIYTRIIDWTKQGANSVKQSLGRLGKELKSGPLSQIGKGFLLGALVVGIKNAIQWSEELRKRVGISDELKKNADAAYHLGEEFKTMWQKFKDGAVNSVGFVARAFQSVRTEKKIFERLSREGDPRRFDRAFVTALAEQEINGTNSKVDTTDEQKKVMEQNYKKSADFLKDKADFEAQIEKNNADLIKDLEKQKEEIRKENFEQSVQDDKDRVDAFIEANKKQAEAERDNIEKNRDLALDAVDKQIEKLTELRDKSAENYATLRREVTDKDFRHQQEQDAKDAKRENKRFNRVLASAHTKQSRNASGRGRTSFSAEEILALRAEGNAGAANAANIGIVNAQLSAEALRQKADNAIINIEAKIDKLLVMK